jgi:hypothetical protein
MENENHEHYEHHEHHVQKKENPYSIPLAIVVAAAIISGSYYLSNKNAAGRVVASKNTVQNTQTQVSALEEAVIPSEGVVLPVTWGDLGIQLTKNGTIDSQKFQSMYESRGQFTEEEKRLLLASDNGKLKITKENAGYILNLLWALGLANNNPILDSGEMVDPRYGGAGNFASTGGWTIAVGSAMNHYSKHSMIPLTAEQQALVDRVSRNIYRPCCGNSTHFPDCNHGMAMLGLLELMASQGVSEQDMYKAALSVNSYWFPDTYMTILQYMKEKGIAWTDASPKEILGATYSSGQGFARIAAQVTQPTQSSQSGGGCGVDSGSQAPVAAPAPRQQSGCGI